MRRLTVLSLIALAPLLSASVAEAQREPVYTRADTLRGSNGPARSWWDVTFYDLHVKVSPRDSTIAGHNAITYRVLRPHNELQFDLQVPLAVDSVVQSGRSLKYRRDGNAFFVALADAQAAGSTRTITVYYHGKPVPAARPPWDGGLIWRQDSLKNRWVSTANQGIGSSIWWPNKDIDTEEPDSQRIAITVPNPMINVSNGRLRSTTPNADGTTTYEWFVTSPINSYGISINAGNYAHFQDTYQGEKGTLTLDFYPLAYHLDVARKHWQEVKPMIACFEKWYGPYPWYEDGYKLVEAPHLGMEHQSAVAYGNQFRMGYSGRDLSGTGHGLKWDFITIHESAHEWWANNVTAADRADMWLHESFANYSEAIYTECQEGRKAGAEYVIGSRRSINNDEPIIPAFGVNAEGSGDMYPKGGSMLHAIRTIINDDDKWRGILRGIQSTFARKTVPGMEVRKYISEKAGIDFSHVFEQYLETTMVPVLEYRIANGRMTYRWTSAVRGFDMPVDVQLGDTAGYTRIQPTTQWKNMAVTMPATGELKVSPDYYVAVMKQPY